MANWTSTRTDAHRSVENALGVVDGLLSYMKDGKGKPAARERTLFAAAVVFTYGIWENYVEQLAIELATNVAERINPERVPDVVRKQLEKRTAWEPSVSPGWRRLWVQNVEVMSIGGDGEKYGLNTAKSGQVRNLLRNAGVEDAFAGIRDDIVPYHLAGRGLSPADAIDRLVELRGEIVHTGLVPDTLRKRHVNEWRQFIEAMADEMDRVCRQQCKTLLS